MIYIADCSSEIHITVNSGRSVDSGVSLTVGDVLTCSAEGASSYRWTNVLNISDTQIYGQTFSISQPGSFNYECTVFMDCGTGVICPLTRNISGLARGMSCIQVWFVQYCFIVELYRSVLSSRASSIRRSVTMGWYECSLTLPDLHPVFW